MGDSVVRKRDGVTVFICGVPEEFRDCEEPLLVYYTIIPEMERQIAERELELDLQREADLGHRDEVQLPEVIPADVALLMEL